MRIEKVHCIIEWSRIEVKFMILSLELFIERKDGTNYHMVLICVIAGIYYGLGLRLKLIFLNLLCGSVAITLVEPKMFLEKIFLNEILRELKKCL